MNHVVNLRELTLRNLIVGVLLHEEETLSNAAVKGIVDAMVLADGEAPASSIDDLLRTITHKPNPDEPTFEIVEIDAGDFEAIVRQARGAETVAINETDIPEIAQRGARGEILTATEQAAWSGYEIGWRDGHNDASTPQGASSNIPDHFYDKDRWEHTYGDQSDLEEVMLEDAEIGAIFTLGRLKALPDQFGVVAYEGSEDDAQEVLQWFDTLDRARAFSDAMLADPAAPEKADEPEKPEECIACEVAFKAGDLVHTDASGGSIHDACTSPGIEGFVDLETLEPLKAGDARPEPTVWA